VSVRARTGGSRASDYRLILDLLHISPETPLDVLTLDEVLEIHEQQIERYGGSSGLPDPAALESAVATPQSTFGGEFLHRTIPSMGQDNHRMRSWTCSR
jgi:hypothetical protein